MDITAQNLIEETYNYYGLKASLKLAVEFIEQFHCATPGSFYEWVNRDNALD